MAKTDAGAPAESPRKRASDHLRVADKLLKSGQLEDAMREVEQALELDPKNAYALAYQQRVKSAMEMPRPGVSAFPSAAPEPPRAPTYAPPEPSPAPRVTEEPPKKEDAARKPQRKLAAIMFTDIVGYSAITQKNESGALKVLETHNQILRPIFQKHEGNVVKTIGDSFLVEFVSVLQAVRCAIEAQDAVLTYTKEANDDARFSIRIGIHLGDVVYQDNDIFGDGVNIASRLQEQAEPGGICVSQDVYNQIRNREGFQAEYVGETELKNIRTPISLYKVLTTEEYERKALEAAIRTAQEDGTSEARSQKLQEYLSRAQDFILNGSYEDAIVEVMKLQALDAGHPEVKTLEESVRRGRKEFLRDENTKARKVPKEKVLAGYAELVREAMLGGALSTEEMKILRALREALQISEEEHLQIEESIGRQA